MSEEVYNKTERPRKKMFFVSASKDPWCLSLSTTLSYFFIIFFVVVSESQMWTWTSGNDMSASWCLTILNATIKVGLTTVASFCLCLFFYSCKVIQLDRDCCLVFFLLNSPKLLLWELALYFNFSQVYSRSPEFLGSILQSAHARVNPGHIESVGKPVHVSALPLVNWTQYWPLIGWTMSLMRVLWEGS